MEFFVNDRCVGCQLCACICPDVFQMTDAGMARARSGPVDQDQLPLAQEARDQCPAQAIEAR